MHPLDGKHILLGISGGIAAYKAAELLRQLRAAGAEVEVVMTEGACRFITPLTLQALAARPVHSGLWDRSSPSAMQHITLARWAERIIIAPASVDCMARLAQGRANDLLGAVCLAARCPIHLAPAMNQEMWRNPATQANAACLAGRAMVLHGPACGDQACGEHGPGRMLEPEQLIVALARSFHSGVLSGLRLMVTAGPTEEPLDPVRHISNRSSGRMGYAIAEAATALGGRVNLISGPVSLPPPARVTVVRVNRAREMLAAVLKDIAGTDIFIAAAAVADYCSARIYRQKIKKDSADTLDLRLERTPDILATVAAREDAPFTVGFAAETDHLRDHALEKLRDKGVDLIAANLLPAAMGAQDNALSLFWPGGELQLATMPKTRLARELLEIVAQRYHAWETRH